MTHQTVRRRLLMDAIEQAVVKHGSLRRAATALGVSAAFLSDIRLGRREAGPKLCRALGLKRRVRVERTTFYDLR